MTSYRVLNLLVLVSGWCVSGQSLPFFLQRFRPVRHGLLAAGSYPAPSSLFPSSSSSSLLSAYGAGSTLGGLGALQGLSSLSSPFTASASSLSPHFGLSSYSSLFAPPTFGSSAHHLTGGSSNYHHHQASSSSPFGSFFPSSGGHHFGASTIGGHQLLGGGGSTAHRFASSAPAFDLGGGIEGLGGFDQGDLLDDYQGFSGSGFAKDLNFAASHPSVKFQSPYAGEHQLFYLPHQRSTD